MVDGVDRLTGERAERARERFERLRSREIDLINVRVGWLLLAQTFLLSGFAAVATADTRPAGGLTIEAILRTVAGVGFGSGLLVLIGNLAAIGAYHGLHRDAQEAGVACPFGVRRWTTQLGFMPALGFPLLFMVAWTCLDGWW